MTLTSTAFQNEPEPEKGDEDDPTINCERVLFVGGSADGRRMFTDKLDRFLIPGGDFPTETYFRLQLTNGMDLMVHEGMTVGEALSMLVEKYPPHGEFAG